jgi:hypothetical protein
MKSFYKYGSSSVIWHFISMNDAMGGIESACPRGENFEDVNAQLNRIPKKTELYSVILETNASDKLMRLEPFAK